MYTSKVESQPRSDLLILWIMHYYVLYYSSPLNDGDISGS
jgi:hypothetical protein